MQKEIEEEITKGIDVKQRVQKLKNEYNDNPFITRHILENPDLYQESVFSDIVDYLCDDISAEDIDENGIDEIIAEFSDSRTDYTNYDLLDWLRSFRNSAEYVKNEYKSNHEDIDDFYLLIQIAQNTEISDIFYEIINYLNIVH
jgi:hypothetical protein